MGSNFLKLNAFPPQLKNFSSILPVGMRDYFEFIFTVAEQTGTMAKVVYGYVTKLEVVIVECEKEWLKSQKSHSIKAGDSESINAAADSPNKSRVDKTPHNTYLNRMLNRRNK